MTEVKTEMQFEDLTRRKCLRCGGWLVVIGRARANGRKTHDDWRAREYHKKCLKLIPMSDAVRDEAKKWPVVY